MDARYGIIFLVALVHVIPPTESRAVNISNTWILPQEGFPVFYRYFRDRISWYEADAVCQFHHANLVTVDTTAQYDAARAYLKELDIMSNVWIGLIKSNDEGDFAWTDYKPLSGEGYWGAAPSDGRAPLCAALDPVHDYRWTALNCGGPQVASFICELPVPSWALSETGGCLVRSLPSLTVQFLPELAAVRLVSDCGLDGMRSVTCKANEEHKDIMKELSCFILDDDFGDNAVTSETEASVSSGSTSNHGGSWSSVPTVSSAGDYSSTRLRRETLPTSTPMPTTTSIGTTGSTPTVTTVIATSPPKPDTTTVNIPTTVPTTIQPTTATSKIDNKLEKNDDVKVKEHTSVNSLDPEQTKTVKEHMNIYTQESDHFIPPLVMAKSKVSTDMTLVSAESKHRKKELHVIHHTEKSTHSTTTNQPTHVTTISPLDWSTQGLIETTSEINKLTTSGPKEIVTQTTSAPETTTVITTQSPTLNLNKDIKYKKPVKGKKYDRLKEEGKKYKTTVVPITTESEHKVVQVTLTNIIGTNSPVTIDITTRAAVTEVTSTSTPAPPINKTEVLIDPNIGVLNMNGTHNNDSEQVEKTHVESTVTPKTDVKAVGSTWTPIERSSSSLELSEAVDHSPDPLPRPNRSRMLTHQPQHRSLYPYFFSRVLG